MWDSLEQQRTHIVLLSDNLATGHQLLQSSVQVGMFLCLLTGRTWHNHGLCGSNNLLYKRCAKLMERPKFRPPTAPTFFNRS